METILIFIVFLSFALCLFLAWFFTHKAKHQERLLMIEKGMNPDEAAEKWSFKSGFLKLGIVIIGLSIGLLIIGLLANFKSLGESGVTPIAILGLCGGGAMILANRIGLNKKP